MTDVTPVIFQEIKTQHGDLIGFASLNSPKTLNAINLAMVQALYKQLQIWQNDERVVAVVINGTGDKAFCAGGDVVSINRASASYGEDAPDLDGQRFFENEYRLDYLIHTYGKPIVVWGSGIVMGGGLGLLAGASHRIVTSSTRMSMPEISIGLFPDVGASWFLNQMKEGLGLFLGTTGVMLNAADALYANLADYFVGTTAVETVLERMANLTWSKSEDQDKKRLSGVFEEIQTGFHPALPQNNILANIDFIQSVHQLNTIDRLEAICHYAGESDWLTSAAKKLKAGCPVTAFVVEAQLKKGQDLSLKEVFKLELVMATNAIKLGHFKEGVRALLIDKDSTPRWKPSTFESVNQSDIDAHFTVPWDGVHPLDDL